MSKHEAFLCVLSKLLKTNTTFMSVLELSQLKDLMCCSKLSKKRRGKSKGVHFVDSCQLGLKG
jgi:hypothetical protein